MLWEWQPDVLQPVFRHWQDCITVILLTNENQCWKQKNHDERDFQSFLLCICPVFITRRMRAVSLWLGLLYFGHAFLKHSETLNDTQVIVIVKNYFEETDKNNMYWKKRLLLLCGFNVINQLKPVLNLIVNTGWHILWGRMKGILSLCYTELQRQAFIFICKIWV